MAAPAEAVAAPVALRRAAVVALATLAADQATKLAVTGAVERGERVEVIFGAYLVNTRNPGVAFGLLADGGALTTAVTALALVGLVIFFAFHLRRPGVWAPVGLLLGGAVGNLVDRTHEEGVIDWIDLPLWPAFNVADAAITAGVVLLLVVLELGARARDRAADAAPG